MSNNIIYYDSLFVKMLAVREACSPHKYAQKAIFTFLRMKLIFYSLKNDILGIVN